MRRKLLNLRSVLPGDVLGSSGCDAVGVMIRACTCSLFGGPSHVAIAACWEDEPMCLVCESTMGSSRPCHIQRKMVSGFQAHRLRSWIVAQNGPVWHWPLVKRLTWDQAEQLHCFCKNHLGVPYDHFGAASARHTVLARLARWVKGENLDEMFCAESVAAAHRRIGVLDTENVSAFSPARLIRMERRLGILGKPRRLK